VGLLSSNRCVLSLFPPPPCFDRFPHLSLTTLSPPPWTLFLSEYAPPARCFFPPGGPFTQLRGSFFTIFCPNDLMDTTSIKFFLQFRVEPTQFANCLIAISQPPSPDRRASLIPLPPRRCFFCPRCEARSCMPFMDIFPLRWPQFLFHPDSFCF